MRSLIMIVACLLASVCVAVAEPLKVGDVIPTLSLPVPVDPLAQEALGVQGKSSFGLADVPGDLIFLEVLGVYCPQCVKQAPGFFSLFQRLNKGKLKGRVTMLGLAAGATEAEVKKLLATGQYAFPVVSDPDFVAHKLLGEPLTPYTILCRSDGTILYAHLGVTDDIDGLMQRIKELLP